MERHHHIGTRTAYQPTRDRRLGEAGDGQPHRLPGIDDRFTGAGNEPSDGGTSNHPRLVRRGMSDVFNTGGWTRTLNTSAVGQSGSVWQLDDATYSVLGTTTILAV